MPKQNKIEVAEVYRGALWNATMIQQMLNENGIEAYIQDEFAGIASPYTFGNLAPIKVIVNATDLEKAKAYLEDFNNNYKEGE